MFLSSTLFMGLKKVAFKVYINTKNHKIYKHKRNFDFEKITTCLTFIKI